MSREQSLIIRGIAILLMLAYHLHDISDSYTSLVVIGGKPLTYFINNMSMVREIGKKSLAVYMLHYFFIPHLLPLPSWIAELDRISVPVFSLTFSIIVLATSMLFVALLTNSKMVAKYALGQK